MAICHALGDFRSGGHGAGPQDFNLGDFVTASVDGVRKTDRNGHVVFLRLEEGLPFANVLPVFIGDFECAALINQIQNLKPARPMTHDLASAMLLQMGCRVTKVSVTELVGSTYHARVYWTAPAASSLAAKEQSGELNIDARPSDAINFAVRFGAPIYVARAVAAKMSHPAAEIAIRTETITDIDRTCREDVANTKDPTIGLQLELQLAISRERYSEAARLRAEIDKMLTGDRMLSLVVAIETALEDKRFEEAQRLRDQLRQLRAATADADAKKARRKTQDA